MAKGKRVDTTRAAEAGLRIMAARKKADLTQEELGSAVHRSRQTINAWENGRGKIGPLEREALARRLGIGVRDIWPESGQMESDVPHETFPGVRVHGLKERTVFAGDVLHKSGRIAQLALSIVADAESQLTLTNELAHAATEQPPPSHARSAASVVFPWAVDHPGVLIAGRRTFLGLSQRELALKVGLRNAAQLAKIEAGTTRDLSPALREKFALILDVAESTLFAPSTIRRKGTSHP